MKGNFCRLCIALLCLLASCSEEENSNEIVITPADYSVKGKVEKGPFIKGSTISLQPLDAKMNPLGTSYSGVIIDNEGSFDLGTLKLDAPYALLITDGFFYNEVQGELSDSRITLQAIVDLKDHSTVNVNLLTHLAKERIKHLIAKGASFHDANKQAQKELLTNFGLQKYAETDVAQFSIAAGTNEAAALLVVSAAIIKERSEAQLTEYLGQLSLDFTANGKFTDEQKDAYRKATLGLDYSTIAANVINRYKEQKKDIKVKDLSYFVDYDGNGIAGDELGDPDTPLELAFEQTTLDVPKDGGTYTIKIRSNIPYSLTYPLDGPSEEVVRPVYPFFDVKTIDHEKSLNEQNNELTINIKAARSFLLEDEEIKLYSMDGSVRSTLTIRQEGDPLNVMNDGTILGLVGDVSIAMSYLHTLEALYTKSYTLNSPSDGWYGIQYPPVRSTDYNLTETWKLSYAIIGRLLHADFYANAIMENGRSDLSFIRSYLSCMRVALFYEMSVLWGNLPCRESYYPNDFATPAWPWEDIFYYLESLLQRTEDFADKKNDYSSIKNMIFVSKDVPASLLARIYLYRNDYSGALKFLEDIIHKGYYQLESSRSEAMKKDSREMVYGFPLSSEENKYRYPSKYILGLNDSFMPIVTYTEILLSAAECCYKSGKMAMANDYLNQVLRKKGLQSTGDFVNDLKDVWRNELKGTGAYYAFLKRNHWAMDELKFKSDYMLLLPIPSQVMDNNPAITQNPGYW